MVEINKQAPPNHIVVIDSNIIWFEDKSKVVSPEFDIFWDKHKSTFPMELIVPEVVRGEILYQQTTSAIKLLTKADALLSSLSAITEKEYSHRITPARVTKEVEKRFDGWILAKKAAIKATPTAIDWQDVISRSIWRRYPFTPDKSNPKNEKGFRDMMILETVSSICKSSSKDVSIAFICNDFALRKASIDRLKAHMNFTAYDSFQEFESFIELTQQDLTDSFVKSLLSKAKSKFESGTAKSKSLKLIAMNYIREEFKDKIEISSIPPTGIGYGISRGNARWIHIKSETTWTKNPQFIKLEGDDLYYWKSRIRIVRLYDKEVTLSMPSILDETGQRLMVIDVAVTWRSNVKKSGRFYKCDIVNYEEVYYSFAPPTERDIERFEIELEQGDSPKDC
jgi:hypothetical protein